MIDLTDGKLTLRSAGQILTVEAWGENSVRVQAFPTMRQTKTLGALTQPVHAKGTVKMLGEDEAELKNGAITVKLDHRQRLTFKNSKGEVLLKEFVRQRAVTHDDGSEDINNVTMTGDFNSTLKLAPREFRANVGGDYELTARFESARQEHLFGMGQYQQPDLDLKFTKLELAQRNSQVTIPFYLSNLGYGFLWNNPGIGEVDFAKNVTEWHLASTDHLDYWVTAGDNPAAIERQYAAVVGRTPMMPDQLLGLWQSKLRYRTDDEVRAVVAKYAAKKVQLSAIVIDFFHWPHQGDYRFDNRYWPDPAQLSADLRAAGIAPIVSVWPTIETKSENFDSFQELGLLVNERRGVKVAMQTQGNTHFVDMTNPQARQAVWALLKKNYVDQGYQDFWLDVAEPGYAVYDFDNYTYFEGTDLQCGNAYPDRYLQMVAEGLNETTDGQHTPVTLVRSAWAGSQKYGALLWSGDIDASFKAFRNQVNTGLNVGIAGIPWWTTDIGGFHGGNPDSPEYRELMARWFEYATFSPVLRMHGFRQPHTKPLASEGGGAMASGAENEIWSYGQEMERLLTKYVRIRETLKPYLHQLMKQAHELGDPIMRPLFYQNPQDKKTWGEFGSFEYMLGSQLLVAPIMYAGQTKRDVYLPADQTWHCLTDNQDYDGGQVYSIAASIGDIPLFCLRESQSDFAVLEEQLVGQEE